MFLLLFALEFMFDVFLVRERKCNNTWTKIFNGKLDTDIVILGNSRAEAHYNPKIITQKTNLRTYNLGLSGTPLNILKIRWKSYINNNPLPKILILDIDYNVLGSSKKIVEKFQYLPYIKYREYKNVSKPLGEINFLDEYLPFYKYSGYHTELTNEIKSYFRGNCSNFYEGHIIRDKLWNDLEWNNFKEMRLNELTDSSLFDSIYKNGVEELKSILDFCIENKIKVFFIWSPQYIEVQDFKNNQRRYVDSLVKNIADKFKIQYINYSVDSLVYDKSYFYNHSHLNKKGADIFSKKVGDFINQSLIK